MHNLYTISNYVFPSVIRLIENEFLFCFGGKLHVLTYEGTMMNRNFIKMRRLMKEENYKTTDKSILLSITSGKNLIQQRFPLNSNDVKAKK